MKSQVTFNTKANLFSQNSFGILHQQENVELEITIGFNNENYGWFELFDIETSGGNWYAEGGLWFDGKTLTDYDGVFSLPFEIVEKLEELGYNADYAK
jgi:hypothetical protein